MKIRNGFVSNSSTSSFCMCGWNKDSLTDEQIKMLEKISIVERFCGSCDTYIGIGNSEGDLHFDEDEGENADSYSCPEPAQEDVDKLIAFAKENNLPELEWHNETWYNG